MSDDDWGDGPVSTPAASNLTSSFKDMNLDESGQGDRGFRGGGRGGRGGGRGGFNNRENGDGGGDQRGGRRDYNNDGSGDQRGGRRDYNNDGGGGGRGGRRDFNNDGDGGGRGGRRDFNNDGDGGGRGGRRDFNNDGDGGGRGGRRDFNNDGDGGSRGGRRDFNNDGDGGGRRDFNNDGDRGGRQDFNKEGGERSGDGNAGEGEEKPRERYCPEDMETGEAIFDSRKQLYQGSGINFSKYEDISHSINGTDVPPEVSTFEEMGLRQLLLANLKKCNYTKPTPIQKFASPVLLAGRDVMACAQTGSGKTAGYLLPIINTLLRKSDELSGEIFPCKPECLILAPTRELALQIGKEANMYGSDSIIKSKVTYGGTSIGHQKAQIQRGCNILVATPGRLLQFVKENIVDLSNIQFFVLNEADRMLDIGFMTDVKQIVAAMPPKEKRVAAMFSATFPVPIQKAAADFLNDYIFVVIGVVGGACTDIQQEFFLTERSEKRSKLLEILKETTADDKVLVFCASKKGADFTAASLSSQGISTTSIHGDRLQSQRELALREFTKGDRKVLVATSVAARGLDIPKVSIVVNYDLPSEIDEYVHRIGRTGRLGHIGRAISFYDETNDSALMPHLVGIIEGAGQPVPDFFSGGGVGPGGDGGVFASTDIRGGFGSGSAAAPAAVEVEEDCD